MRNTSGLLNYVLRAAFLVVAFCSVVPVRSLVAESRYAAAFKSCRSYSSPAEFVRRTSLYCIKQPNSTACEREARALFEACGFSRETSYSKISRLIYEKLFLAVVTAKLIDVNRLEK